MKYSAVITILFIFQAAHASEPPSAYYDSPQFSDDANIGQLKCPQVIETSFGSIIDKTCFTLANKGTILGRVTAHHTAVVLVRSPENTVQECEVCMIGKEYFIATIDLQNLTISDRRQQFQILLFEKDTQGKVATVAENAESSHSRLEVAQSFVIEKGRKTEGVTMLEPSRVVR